MATLSSKQSISSYEEESFSDSSTPDEEKAIPFLRRLRDMLTENKNVISFITGHYSSNAKILGRIVVHDRVQVEANVLPRYFNHSSFASLRRQLNYFNFVRLGKGRQRESMYVNECVVVLDDILHLKRRPSIGNSCSVGKITASKRHFYGERNGSPPLLKLSGSIGLAVNSKTPEYRRKRRRHTVESKPTTISPRSASPVDNHTVSEPEESQFRNEFVVLDLTKPEYKPDKDILAGCHSLLLLSSKGWQ